MVFRMLAVSVDGTLLKQNGRMAKETKDAIDYVRNKGVYTTIVADRDFQSSKKIAKVLRIDHEFISHRGAFIAGNADRPVFEERMSYQMTADVVGIMEQFGGKVRLSHEKFELSHPQTANLLGKLTIGLGEAFFQSRMYAEHLYDHILDHRISALMVEGTFLDAYMAENVKKELEADVPGIRAELLDNKIVVQARDVSKWNAVYHLSAELGIQPQEIVYIGATESDREAIANAGLGVAMGNAPQTLKDIADWVTRSCDQNGVAYMVREVFRKQMRVKL